MSALTSHQPLATSTPPLPPSPRDFEIHRLHLVHHMSTWRLAEKYEISQTRIRQIVKHVSEWLVETMPVKTEAELEKETRLAQHIAADQLQHQLELLQNYFDGSGGDPKYSRQQTRVILALARLGTIPGSIDALAADAEEKVVRSGPERTDAAADTPSQSSSPTNASSNRPLSSFTLHPSSPSPPPLGDFSPIAASTFEEISPPATAPAPTPLHAEPFHQIEFPYDDALAGLCLMEKNLLTLIDNTTHDDPERLESLHHSLANIRRQKAIVQLRLSPALPGAEITERNAPTFNLQPLAQAPA